MMIAVRLSRGPSGSAAGLIGKAAGDDQVGPHSIEQPRSSVEDVPRMPVDGQFMIEHHGDRAAMLRANVFDTQVTESAQHNALHCEAAIKNAERQPVG
jgi:hypothetical protein